MNKLKNQNALEEKKLFYMSYYDSIKSSFILNNSHSFIVKDCKKYIKKQKKCIQENEDSLRQFLIISKMLLKAGAHFPRSKSLLPEDYLYKNKNYRHFLEKNLQDTTDFHLAVEEMNLEQIKNLIKDQDKVRRININDENKYSPLFKLFKKIQSAKKEKKLYTKEFLFSFLRVMIQEGKATLRGEPCNNIGDAEDMYPLSPYSAQQDNEREYFEDILKNIDSYIQEIEEWNKTGNTPLHNACLKLDTDKIILYAQTERHIQSLNKKNQTPLFCLFEALKSNENNMSRTSSFTVAFYALSKHGATLSGKNRWELYPLTCAPDIREKEKITQFIESIIKNKEAILKYTEALENDDTPLHIACRALDDQLIDALLKKEDNIYINTKFESEDRLLTKVEAVEQRGGYKYYSDYSHYMNKAFQTPLMCVFEHLYNLPTHEQELLQEKAKKIFSCLIHYDIYLYEMNCKEIDKMWENRKEIYEKFIEISKVEQMSKLEQMSKVEKKLTKKKDLNFLDLSKYMRMKTRIPFLRKWIDLLNYLPSQKNQGSPKHLLFISGIMRHQILNPLIKLRSYLPYSYYEEKIVLKLKELIDQNECMRSYVQFDIVDSIEGFKQCLSKQKYWMIIVSSHGSEDGLYLLKNQDEDVKVNFGSLQKIMKENQQKLSCFLALSCSSYNEKTNNDHVHNFVPSITDYYIGKPGNINDSDGLNMSFSSLKSIFKGKTIPQLYAHLIVKFPSLKISGLNQIPQNPNALYEKKKIEEALII